MKNKKKTIGIIIGIVALLLVIMFVGAATITGVVIFNLPVNKAGRAINSGNYAKLEQAYDKASENSKAKIVSKCEDKADKLLAEYVDDKITYEESYESITGLSDSVDSSVGLLESISKLEAVHNNKDNYEKAMDAMERGDYAVANGYFSDMTDDMDKLLEKSAADIELCAEHIQEEIVGVWWVNVDLAESVNEADFVEGNEALAFPAVFKIEFKDNQTGVAIIPEESYWNGLSTYAIGGYDALVKQVEDVTGYKGQDAKDYISFFYGIENAEDLYKTFLIDAPYVLGTFSKQFQYKIDGNYILITDDNYTDFKIGYRVNEDGTLSIDLMGYEGFVNILDTNRYNKFDMQKENPDDVE